MTTLPNTQSQNEPVDVANLLKRRCELLEELLAQAKEPRLKQCVPVNVCITMTSK
jgi:hypothetical protein